MQISESIAFKKKVLIKDAEKQMELRSVVSDKQKLIAVLEKTYTKATSEKHFYKQLEQKGIKLYSRNNQIVGAKLIRKFRFKTLCYDKSILRDWIKTYLKIVVSKR